MMILPPLFVQRMKIQLGNEADAFFESLEQPSPTSIRLHHQKGRSTFDLKENVLWCNTGYYLASRPFFHLDPHWHGGAYYVQEASSMILDYVINQLNLDSKNRIWLDLCAAPGGKTGILAKHLGLGDVLVANEVVSQRRSILRENLIKAGFCNTFISGEPASSFTEPFADIILIDAPCAGEGMMRKDPEAIHQWTPSLVQSCTRMQQQIVGDAASSLRKDGYLIYSTCSYSMDENIKNVKHFIRTQNLQPVSLPFPSEWGITQLNDGDAIGYQLFPHKVKGEGLFIAVLRKTSEEESTSKKFKKLPSHFEAIPDWMTDKIKSSELLMVRKNSTQNELITKEAEGKASEVINLLPRAQLINDAGELKGKDFVPSHALAMSGLHHEQIEIINLDLSQALDYLERNTNSLPFGKSAGWHLVSYDSTTLGWVKSTAQGWKNYFPMNWRLRDRRLKS